MTAEESGLARVAGKLRYFQKYRPIRKHQGQKHVIITLGDGKKVKLNTAHVQRWPAIKD